uniref:Uncharacterized protein n=1 Tax=Anopheles maculatus TaxID=74869 RepID=A0A182SHX4_9DIPT
MYVINPAPASQDLQPTASSYVTAHRPESPETIELQQQQHKEILSQILTKCNADMSEQVANFSCPDEKTPPRSTAAVVKEGAKRSTSPAPPAGPKVSSPCTDEQGHGLKQIPEPSLTSKQASSSASVGAKDTGRHGSNTTDGDVRSPPATFKRSTSPDGSPLSTASSSNAASLSPASSDGPAKPPPKPEQLTESLAPASNFASVVHPKERALKSIAAAAASNERNNAAANGGTTSATAAKTSTKFTGTGRTALNGAASFPTGTTATVGTGTPSGGRLQFFKGRSETLEISH